MEELITVTGRGSLHVVPDVTRLDLSLVSLHDSYEEAYARAEADNEQLTKIMGQLKLPAARLKTVRLNIEKKLKADHDNFPLPVGGGRERRGEPRL